MKKHIIYLFALTTAFLAATTTSCTDDLVSDTSTIATGKFTPKGELVDVYLSLNVAELSIKATTRTASDDSEAERRINDIWVFQYDYKDSTHPLINKPYYRTIQNQEELADLTDIVDGGYVIKASNNDGDPSIIYVVANTHDSTWALTDDDYTGFNSLEALKMQTIPNPEPIRISSSDEGDDGGANSDESLAIPMGGSRGVDGTLVINSGYRIQVDVERMFAKLYVTINLKNGKDVVDSNLEKLMIEHITRSCTVATCYNDDGSWYYPSGTGSNFEVSRTFTPDTSTTKTDGDTKTYGAFIMYVPENYQEETFDNAINLTPYMNYEIQIENNETAKITPSPSYTAYPGSWNAEDLIKNYGENYEIRRNNIYDITLSIVANDAITASANCLIATAGETIAFYPYVRDEEPTDLMLSEDGTRYIFETYLNSSYENGQDNDGLKIKGLKIIWQTYNCIGDNSRGNLVWIDDAPDDDEEDMAVKSYKEYHRKIYVKTSNPGNALIAAYDDDNCEGNILWSWHIWVPNKDVDPEGDAIEYYHYLWNENGIQTNTYVPGRLVMKLNLGALDDKVDGTGQYNDDTYGTLYQWGRKDPFPPIKSHYTTYTPLTTVTKGGAPYFFNYADYTYETNKGTKEVKVVIGVYDNEDKPIDLTDYDGSSTTGSTRTIFGTKLSSSLGTNDQAIIVESIKNPTMFIAAASQFPETGNGTGTGESNNRDSYINQGDWLYTGDDFLWGGGHTDGIIKYHVYSQGTDGLYTNQAFDAYLENDYGDNKTIFDPCPYGWRVSPGDLWLGFTKDGANWVHNGDADQDEVFAQINCADQNMIYVNSQNGYNMYMQGWEGEIGDETSFFPVQPARVPSGQPYLNGGICGNYHNATVDEVMTKTGWSSGIRRVDILHFHAERTDYGMVKPFTNEIYYYTKAVAGPLRCVRDIKKTNIEQQ